VGRQLIEVKPTTRDSDHWMKLGSSNFLVVTPTSYLMQA